MNARAKAWATRRQRYGAAGHSGPYLRYDAPNVYYERMLAVIVRLYAEGLLGEGQAAKATGRDRVWLRKARDEFNSGTGREEEA